VIEVRLFGDLRHYAGQQAAPSGVAVPVSPRQAATVGQALALLGIGPGEVGNVFLNGRLLPLSTRARAAQAVHLGYVLAHPVPLSPEASLDVPLEDGDRLGVFARKMGLLVV
jgi:hypothetical protein